MTLKLVQVSKLYSSNGSTESRPRAVLDNIDLTVKQGAVLGLLGKTGAGKTTLGKILCGILRPDRGSTVLDGMPLAGLSGRELRRIRRDLRYVPQNPDATLSSNVRVSDALTEAASLSRLSGANLKHWEQRLMAQPLFREEWLNRRVHDLSVGERKRVVHLRALLTMPRFIVLDEPFNGLDLISKGAFMSHLNCSTRDHQTGILIISHDTVSLRQMTEDIVYLRNGRLEEWHPTEVSAETP